MAYTGISMLVLWICLFFYVIAAGIYFGTGCFAFYMHMSGEEKKVKVLYKYMINPIWGLINICCVFCYVGMIALFPSAIHYLNTMILIPGSIALICIIIRGCSYIFINKRADISLPWLLIYCLSGLGIPAALASVLIISEGGYIIEDGAHLDLNWVQLAISPFAWSVVFLAVITVLYISAGFLTYSAAKLKDTHVYLTVRKWLLLWSMPMIMVSLFVFLSLRIQNANHFTNAIYNYWWMFTLSLLCFIIAMSLALLKKYHGIAMLMMILQLFFAFFGYGLSKLPYIVYPFVKITDTTVSVATGLTLMIVIILGLLLLIPSLILLLRLATDNKGIVKNQK